MTSLEPSGVVGGAGVVTVVGGGGLGGLVVCAGVAGGGLGGRGVWAIVVIGGLGGALGLGVVIACPVCKQKECSLVHIASLYTIKENPLTWRTKNSETGGPIVCKVGISVYS